MANPFDDFQLELSKKDEAAIEKQKYAHVKVKLATSYSKAGKWPTDEDNANFRNDLLRVFKELNLRIIKEAQSEQGFYKVDRQNPSDKTEFRINGNEMVGYIIQTEYSDIMKALQSTDSIKDLSEVSYIPVCEITKKKLARIMTSKKNAEKIAQVIRENYDMEDLKANRVTNASGIDNFPTSKDFSESNAKIHIIGEIGGHSPNSADSMAVNYISKQLADDGDLNVLDLQNALGTDAGKGQGYDDDD